MNHTALLIVDMQNDFVPGGSLAVPEGHDLVPIINKLIPKFSLICATKDWHPKEHKSFATNHPGKKVGEKVHVKNVEQILWPVHCVRETKGSEFVPGLKKEAFESIFYKGTDEWVDSYSAFFDNARQKETGLHEFLQSRGVVTLFVAGIATDYCVLYSVLDALDLGYNVVVIRDACKGIDLRPGDIEAAFRTMHGKGARIVNSAEV